MCIIFQTILEWYFIFIAIHIPSNVLPVYGLCLMCITFPVSAWTLIFFVVVLALLPPSLPSFSPPPPPGTFSFLLRLKDWLSHVQNTVQKLNVLSVVNSDPELSSSKRVHNVALYHSIDLTSGKGFTTADRELLGFPKFLPLALHKYVDFGYCHACCLLFACCFQFR